MASEPLELDLRVSDEQFGAALEGCPCHLLPDWSFQVGDWVVLRGWDGSAPLRFRVAYVLRGAFFHVPPNQALVCFEVPRG